MTIALLPAELRKLIQDKDWIQLAQVWENNKRNKRRDSLSPEQIASVREHLKAGTSVRETAALVKVNRGRVWYIYKLLLEDNQIARHVKVKKSKAKAEDFI